MKALIIGYGSAGKRHHGLIQKRFDTIGIVDTDPSKLMDAIEYDESVYIYVDPEEALNDVDWDVAVICTPPDSHIWYIEECIQNNMWVMCEKPLCDFGQLGEAWDLMNHANWRKVMVAYNYLFHTWILDGFRDDGYTLTSWGYRHFYPSWGLLLDHGSHALSIIRYLASEDSRLTVVGSWLTNKNGFNSLMLTGETRDGVRWEVVDHVSRNPHDRRVFVSTPDGSHDFIPDHKMFDLMWDSFLEGVETNTPQWPGLDEALEVQDALEQANKLLVEEVG